MDDILSGGGDLKTLERGLWRLFLICRKENIKLNPTMFKLRQRVVLGDCGIAHNSENDLITIDPDNKKIRILEELSFPKMCKEAHLGYSPANLETLMIVWALTKSDFYGKGAPKKKIKTDSTAARFYHSPINK